MNIEDYLLACISEEAGEIIQAVGKSHRFGVTDKNPNTNDMNFYELKKEIHDLIAVYEMFCAEYEQYTELDRTMIEKKKERVKHYMQYSKYVAKLDY